MNLPAFGITHLPKHFNALHLQAVFCLSSHQNLICQFDPRLNASSERGMLCFLREQMTPVVFWSKPQWFSTVIKLWGTTWCVVAAISQANPGSFSCTAGSVEKKGEYSWTHDFRTANHELNLCSHCEDKLFYYGPFMLKMLCTKEEWVRLFLTISEPLIFPWSNHLFPCWNAEVSGNWLSEEDKRF